MRKRILSLLLAIIMTISLGTTVLADDNAIVNSGTCGKNLTWTLDSAGLLTISGTGEMWDSAFSYNKDIKSVRLPDAITQIPYKAFSGCTNLKNIRLPDSVTQIDEDAFGNCDLQEQVVQEIVSSDNITFIGSRAFEGNKNIYTVHIGKNVEYIQTETFNYMSTPSFHDCTNLTSITVSPENQTYTSINGLLCSKDGRSLLYVPVGISGRLDVPAGIETIGREAMHYAFSIKIVHIPKSVKKIGSDAFPIECTDVYYDGTEEQWNEISIGKNYNSDFPSGVTLHFTCEKHTYQNGVCTRCGAKDPNYKLTAPSVKTDYLISTGKPYIKWAAVAGANKYEVYRSGSKDGTYTLLGTTTNLNYTDSKANAGYIYYYKVKAVNANSIKSDYSATVAATCHCARPVVKPDYLISTGKPYIKWTAVSGASKYEVYRSGSKDGTYTLLGTTTAANYTDSKANAGYTYYYKVKAISSVKNTANSALSAAVAVTCRCARPVVKPDYLISTGKPYIKWTAVSGASKYYVYRSGSKDGTYTLLGTTTATNYTDNKANAGYTYYYKVKAVSKVSSGANSYYSVVIGATCHCARPSVKITTSNGSPRLTWNAVTGASQYEVYRATSKNGSYTKMFTTSNLSYTNTSAKAGTTYYYKVKAVSKVKSTANSAFSTVVSIRAR
jgi:fibronectin type 3 domain-containing protein